MMATGVWNRAASLLRDAAAIIEQRSAGRDVSGLPDTVAVAAVSEGLSEATVLASMVGLKRARYARGHDYDSAIDLLAYEARRLVSTLPLPAELLFTGQVAGDYVAPPTPPQAAEQFEAACSGPELNHAGGSLAE